VISVAIEPISTTDLRAEVELPRVRPVTMADLDSIHALIEMASRATTVLPRGREELCECLRDFIVAEQEQGRIIGCAALSVFGPALAEVRSLVVDPTFQGRGAGARMIDELIREAGRLGIRRLFALTDNVPFFECLGFKPTDKATLPQKVWTECIRCPKYLDCQEEAVDLDLGSP